MSAAEDLADLVSAAADRGQPVPCWRRHLWISDAPEDRARAAAGCQACPANVRDACRAAADEARAVWGVWDGLDYAEPALRTWRRRPSHESSDDPRGGGQSGPVAPSLPQGPEGGSRARARRLGPVPNLRDERTLDAR